MAYIMFKPRSKFEVLLSIFLMGLSLPDTPTCEAQTETETAAQLTLDSLFLSDRVIEVKITVAEEDWDTIRKQKRSIMKALGAERKEKPLGSPYTYVEAQITIEGHEFPKVGLRKKGFVGSQSDTRPSLKIKLNRHDREASIEGVTTLTLNNNNQDPTLVNQYLGYALFNAADSPASRCAFAHVTLNGKSLGVYSHVESVKRHLAKRNFGSDQGTMYEGTVVDFHEGWGNSFEQKFGDDEVGREKIHELIGVLQQEDSDELEQAIGQLVDLNAFYKFWALEGLVGFWDGYSANRNNYFVYLHPDSKKFHFMPWGADALFSKHSKIAYDGEAPISVKTTGLVAHKLYQTANGRKRYEQALRELLETVWDEEKLLAECDRIEVLLEPHLIPAQNRFSKSLEGVRKFIRTRREQLLAEISDGMPVWNKPPDAPLILSGDTAAWTKDSILNAAKEGDLKAIGSYLMKGGDVDTRDPRGTTPLIMAALAGQVETAKFLLLKGADINVQNDEGNTPLHTSAFLGWVEMSKLLIEKKADLNARNQSGHTPLDSVAELTDDLKGVIDFLSNILSIDFDLENVKAGRTSVAKLLRDAGAKSGADMPKLAGANIWESAKLGNIAELKKHAAVPGVDLDARDKKGVTPLSWAAMAGQVEAVKFLVDAGADVNATNMDKATPLHAAAFLGRKKVVQLLLDNKAEINLRNNYGQTPLGGVTPEWTAELERITLFLKTFLQLDVNIGDVKAARPEIAKLLRKNGGKTAAELD